MFGTSGIVLFVYGGI